MTVKVVGDASTGLLSLVQSGPSGARALTTLHPREAAALSLALLEAILSHPEQRVQAEAAPLLPSLGSATPTVGGVNLSYKPLGSTFIGALVKLTPKEAERLGAELLSAAKAAI